MSEGETVSEVTDSTTEDSTDEVRLPDDHPLLKTLDKQKTEISRLKDKAAKLAAIFETEKSSESEKTADAVSKARADAEAEIASVPIKVAEGLKTHLIELHSIDPEDAELFLTAQTPELLLKQVTRLLDRSDKRRNKNRVPNEGTNPSAATSELADFARNLFDGN